MTINLEMHLEATNGELIWWATSPDVSGFSAAAPSLDELRAQAKAALCDVLEIDDVAFSETLVGEDLEIGNLEREEGRYRHVPFLEAVA